MICKLAVYDRNRMLTHRLDTRSQRRPAPPVPVSYATHQGSGGNSPIRRLPEHQYGRREHGIRVGRREISDCLMEPTERNATMLDVEIARVVRMVRPSQVIRREGKQSMHHKRIG